MGLVALLLTACGPAPTVVLTSPAATEHGAAHDHSPVVMLFESSRDALKIVVRRHEVVVEEGDDVETSACVIERAVALHA